jgi:hypothetical protein
MICKKMLVIAAVVVVVTTPAHAMKRRVVSSDKQTQTQQASFSFFSSATFSQTNKPVYAGGLGGKPRLWCGWWMRQQVGSDPGPQFNLVASWHRYGSPSGPIPGAVAIWRNDHHVGKVVSVNGSEVCTISGNSGPGGVNQRCEPLNHFAAFRT